MPVKKADIAIQGNIELTFPFYARRTRRQDERLDGRLYIIAGFSGGDCCNKSAVFGQVA